MWKLIMNLVAKNGQENKKANPVRPLRPVEQYVQLTLPLTF